MYFYIVKQDFLRAKTPKIIISVTIFGDENEFGNNKRYFHLSRHIKKFVLQAKLFRHGVYFVPPSEPLCYAPEKPHLNQLDMPAWD